MRPAGPALALCLAFGGGCGAQLHGRRQMAVGDDITMYRDAAVVRQRFVLDLPAGMTTAKLEIAANVTIDKVAVIDRGVLQIAGLHAALTSDETAEAIAQARKDAGSGSEVIYDEEDPPPPPTEAREPSTEKPTELRLDVLAPHAGRFTIQLAYVTDRMKWDAAYTMTATPSRDRALLRGAVAIRNTTAIGLHVAHVHLVDAELGTWRGKIAEYLASSLIGGEPSSTRPAAARDLGVVDMIQGESRVELLPDDPSPQPFRRMRSVLVYDPYGTKLDNPGTIPAPDPQLGVAPAASTRITESFEVERDEVATAGLPAGPVRLLERRPDGSLAVLGQSRLFDAATRVAEVDTIAIGTADAVVAHRERRELTNDQERHRLTEEFQITVDNERATPVGVLLREHLYRGQSWTLAYHSAPSAAKEGSQQIALRTTVPAKGHAKVVYVVVYTWQP